MTNVIKSTVGSFIDQFEQIGSQTVKQGVQAAKQVVGDVVAKPIREAVGTPIGSKPQETGTNEQAVQQQPQVVKMQLDDQKKAQQQMAQIRQNLEALIKPKEKQKEKPVYYQMWEAMEKKKKEKQELEIKKHEEAAAVRAMQSTATGEKKGGIGG